MTAPSPPHRGAGSGEPPHRALAPDLARGVMLLLIALAHAPAYLHARELGPGGYPADGSTLDRAVAGIETTVVTGRAYPMFALLLGYGLAQLAERRRAAGYTPAEVRTLLRRRGAALLLLGFAHAALLWGGDILGAYGVLTVVLAGATSRMPDRRLLQLGCVSWLVVAAGGASDLSGPLASTGTPDALAAVGLRLTEWWPSLLLQPLGVAGAALLGVWAARRRVLEEPGRHRLLLRRTAALGLGAAFLSALPLALINAGVWQHPPAWADALSGALHSAGGYGGIGYAALIALVSVRLTADSRLVTALAACGQRSLSCYLAQSAAFVPALAAYAGGLGAEAGTTSAALIATGVWAATVAAAEWLRRKRYRGPAETLLRTLTHGRPPRAADPATVRSPAPRPQRSPASGRCPGCRTTPRA